MSTNLLLSGIAMLGLVGAPLTANNNETGSDTPAKAAATVTGKIVFDGKEMPKIAALDMASKPEHKEHCMKATDKNARAKQIDATTKGVANVYVELRNKATRKMKWQPEGEITPSDQVNCRFEPHVMVVPVGKEIVFKNSDPFMHNVHFYCKKNAAANFGIPENGSKAVTFKSDEKVRVKCDVHTWMDSWVVATSNPYHALTGPDGSFKIEGVDPGEYEVRMWHESFGGFKKKKVQIGEGDNTFEAKTSEFKP